MRPLQRPVRALAAALTLVPLAPAQEQLEFVDLDEPSGVDVASVGRGLEYPDVDGDGAVEVYTLMGVTDSPTVRIWSTARGRTLRTMPLGFPFINSGALVDDLDADGWPDVVFRSGLTLRATSVRTGRTLWTRVESVAEAADDLCGIPDANGDDVPDVVVGLITTDVIDGSGATITYAGSARLLSGADGALLDETTFLELPFAQFGQRVVSLGDGNGDGHPEVAVGSDMGRAAIWTPNTGTPPTILATPAHLSVPTDPDAYHLVGFGGVGGNHPYLAVGDTEKPAGLITIYSTTTGQEVAHFKNESAPESSVFATFGTDLTDAGDLNGDGVDDLLCSRISAFQGKGWIAYSGNFPFPIIGVDPGGATYGNDDTFHLGRAGDLDGDGRHEFWLGEETPDGINDTGPTRLRAYDIHSSASQPKLEIDDSDGVGLGAALAVLGDLDGDGSDELAVGAPHLPTENGPGSGRVTVFNANGLVLYELSGQAYEQYGAAIVGLDDLDDDDIEDFAVGRPWAQWGLSRRGAVTVVSGATGQTIRNHGGANTGERFGATLARIPDANGDDVDDYAIGAPEYDGSGIAQGRVALYSGADGSLISSMSGPINNARFGTSIAGIDLYADGLGDLLIGAPGAWSSITAFGAGQVWTYVGWSGVAVDTVTGDNALERFGTHVATLGDVDGDGREDWAASSPRYNGLGVDDGRVQVRSGANESLIREHVGGFGEELGSGLVALGDQDNDGVGDYAIGSRAWLALSSLETRGRVAVHSGADGATLEALLSAPVDSLIGFEDDGFGTVLATGGDRDGGGLLDLAIGRPAAVDTGSPIGVATFLAAGTAESWSLRAVGTKLYGAGSPGCAGAQTLSIQEPVEPGDAIQLRLSGLEPGVQPFTVAALDDNEAGVPLPGIGALLHLDLLTIVLTEAAPPATGSYSDFSLPTPNIPSLAGLEIHLQEFVLWPLGCATTTSGWSSSSGVSLVFQ